MNPEVKAKWVARLRSGQDKQGKTYLNRNDRKCCIGVLCEIAAEEKVIERVVSKSENTVGYRRGHGFMEILTLPDALLAWSGLEDNWGTFNRKDEVGNLSETSLTGLNDNGYTFDQIADYIEEYF